jgi:hypothetical protein
MNRIKVGFGVLALAIFISWFSFGTAYAQVGFDVWETRWLKVNTNFKGYERNLAGPPDWFTDYDRFTLYVYISSWNDPDQTPNTRDEYFSADFYYFDDLAGWQSVRVTLNYLHGTPLDLLVWALNDQGVFPGDNTERLTFAARLSGKLMRGTTDLQTASFKCLGGYFIEIAPDDPEGAIYAASGVTMTGGLVPATFCNSTTNQQYPPCWQPN